MTAFLKQFGDCTGPLGFPMKSAEAKELETLISTLDSNCKEIGFRRTTKMPTGVTFEEGERADVSLITTDVIDADREVVMQNGLDWSRFKKAGMPVTWCHMYDCLPVGRAAWVKKYKEGDVNGWLAKTLYTAKPDNWNESWFADAVWHMVKEKIIRGKSIGYIPTKMRAPTEKESKANEGLRWVFESVTILEYAVTPIQSNPDAVVQEVAKCIKKGLKIPDRMLEDMGLIFADDGDPVTKTSGDPPTPALPPIPEKKGAEAPPAMVPFLTLDQWNESVQRQLADNFGTKNFQKMYQDQLDLRMGRV